MTIYTYFDGEKLILEKEEDSFIARADAEQLKQIGLDVEEQTSSASWRIRTDQKSLSKEMEAVRSHNIVAHHAYRIKDTKEPFLISDRIVVTFSQPPTETHISHLITEYTLELVDTLSDEEYVFRVTDATGMNPIKLVAQLTEAQARNVETVNHDLNMLFQLHTSRFRGMPIPPSDPHFRRQWHLHHGFRDTYVSSRSSTRCLEAWTLLSSYGDSEVVIGITDDGCKLDHPDFNAPGKFADWGYWEGDDFVHSCSIGAHPSRMYDSGANHGTSCAGVSAAEADGVLTVGAAPGCRLLPIKWETIGRSLSISTVQMAKTLNFVADKVDILSNSWGTAPHTRWPRNVTERIRHLAICGGRRKSGILFLWSAGNNNCPIRHAGNVDVPYTEGWARAPNGRPYWIGVKTSTSFTNILADIPGVMHVAALASTAKRSHYSNYGPGIDICAPSNNVHTYGRLHVHGLGIYTTTGPRDSNSADEVTNRFGGTSSSTPLVAGIAALVISANPNLTALEVKEYLERTAVVSPHVV